jgi:hypothetical protein
MSVDSTVAVVLAPHMMLEPQRALNPWVVLEPHTAELLQTAEMPHMIDYRLSMQV